LEREPIDLSGQLAGLAAARAAIDAYVRIRSTRRRRQARARYATGITIGVT